MHTYKAARGLNTRTRAYRKTHTHLWNTNTRKHHEKTHLIAAALGELIDPEARV